MDTKELHKRLHNEGFWNMTTDSFKQVSIIQKIIKELTQPQNTVSDFDKQVEQKLLKTVKGNGSEIFQFMEWFRAAYDNEIQIEVDVVIVDHEAYDHDRIKELLESADLDAYKFECADNVIKELQAQTNGGEFIKWLENNGYLIKDYSGDYTPPTILARFKALQNTNKDE